jgi:hypothetical protein
MEDWLQAGKSGSSKSTGSRVFDRDPRDFRQNSHGSVNTCLRTNSVNGRNSLVSPMITFSDYRVRGPNPEIPEQPAPFPPGPEEPAPQPPQPELPDTRPPEPTLPNPDPDPDPIPLIPNPPIDMMSRIRSSTIVGICRSEVLVRLRTGSRNV